MAMQHTDTHQHGPSQYPHNPSSHRQSYYGADYEMAIRLSLSLSDRHPSRDRWRCAPNIDATIPGGDLCVWFNESVRWFFLLWRNNYKDSVLETLPENYSAEEAWILLRKKQSTGSRKLHSKFQIILSWADDEERRGPWLITDTLNVVITVFRYEKTAAL